jgi:hypothetical protein
MRSFDLIVFNKMVGGGKLCSLHVERCTIGCDDSLSHVDSAATALAARRQHNTGPGLLPPGGRSNSVARAYSTADIQ